MSQKIKSFKPTRGISGGKKFVGSNYDHLYQSPRWRSYTAFYLIVNTKCYACGQKSECLDHITPHKGDESLFFKEDNIIPLCHRCHNTITSRFDKHYIPGKSTIEEKLKFINNSRTLNENFVKAKIVPFKK